MQKHRQRMGMKSGGGEIVQVQGGHIVRSTGRKDRHSKVSTAKGPRDRRVRLSALTAIQFYDVQDRLGYDRPSKAVDWLLKKAKSAIDKLAELPPWNPTETATDIGAENNDGGSREVGIAEQSESSGYSFQLHRQLSENPSNDSSFMRAQLDPDAIPDNMKSFFPMSSATSSMNFQSYQVPDMITRSSNHTEDLGLSLHSFQDHQGLIHGQSQGDHAPTTHHHHQTLFAAANPVGFEANFHRMMAWNDETGAENRSSGGFAFDPPQLLSQASQFSQRGSLQSSFSQSVRAWNDLPMTSTDHGRAHELHHIFGSRFLHEGLPSFSIPAGIQGEEEQCVVSDRPSSFSPNSQH